MKCLVSLFLYAAHVLAVSQIALFTDEHCKDSLRGLEGPNGYPNGTCTDLRRNGPYGSFQVVGLDPGCAVTIYQKDTTEDPCSGYQEEIQPIDCYNSTFVYYSIDFCDAGGSNQSPSPPLHTSTSAPSSSSGLSTGAIVGATLGGVAGLGIIVGLVVFFILRKRRRTKARSSPEVAEYVAPAPAEVHAKHLHEMGSGAIAYKREAAFEVEQPAAELEGTEVMADERSRDFRS